MQGKGSRLHGIGVYVVQRICRRGCVRVSVVVWGGWGCQADG